MVENRLRKRTHLVKVTYLSKTQNLILSPNTYKWGEVGNTSVCMYGETRGSEKEIDVIFCPVCIALFVEGSQYNYSKVTVLLIDQLVFKIPLHNLFCLNRTYCIS